MGTINCSIGIFAYNEEKNIGKVIEAVLFQNLQEAGVDEIFIIASGCTDRTVEIARKFESQSPKMNYSVPRDGVSLRASSFGNSHPRPKGRGIPAAEIKIIVQKEREGKYSAINLFLKLAKNDTLIMESADTIPDKNAIENLVRPFANPKIGMTGAKPVPIDNPNTFMGYTTHLLWNLHHWISLKTPKMGEMVAFRKVFSKIPQTSVDEAYIESVIKGKGYEILYIPEAIVYNKGPANISDFLLQRRRIHCGHLQLNQETGYQVTTSNLASLTKLVFKNLKPDFKCLFFLVGAVFLEMVGSFLGWWDYKVNQKSHVVWGSARSTKELKR